VSPHPNCKKHLKKVPRLTQNTTCPHEYLKRDQTTYPGNIQGTFREHSGNVQGIFREHSGNIQGTFREHTGRIRRIFREHSGNIQGTFRERSGNIQGTFREHSGNVQGAYREDSENIQGTFREHSGNIQGTLRDHPDYLLLQRTHLHKQANFVLVLYSLFSSARRVYHKADVGHPHLEQRQLHE
jgi:hypothetical protein